MYINSAYLNDSLLNCKDTQNPISVGSCGNYRLITVNQLPTFRPNGRLDYQLIYIASGAAHFYFKSTDEATVIPAGTFVLFRPREYQKYIYYGSTILKPIGSISQELKSKASSGNTILTMLHISSELELNLFTLKFSRILLVKYSRKN